MKHAVSPEDGEPMRRQRRKILTDKMVAGLPRKRRRYIVSDPEQRGMYIRVPSEGPAVYAVVARDPYRKQIWHTVGSTSLFTLEEARTRARAAIIAIKDGADHSGPQTFAAISEQWIKRHVEAKGLRTAG
ncbi:MAG: integrase arm-type DNA-binding domain-containing protein, partial [Pseudolabrys sp.]